MLIGWFPLNNNFQNSGLDSVDLNNSGASFVNSGKVTANCLKLNSTATSYTIMPSLAGGKVFSVAFWFKGDNTATATSWSDLFSFKTTNGSNEKDCRVEITGNVIGSGEIKFFNNGHWSAPEGLGGMSFDTNWHHYVWIFTETQVFKYKDGIINGTPTNKTNPDTVSLTGHFRIGDTSASKGYLNDVRIYDHVLSPTEIKKLAQGLACHFTFNFEDFYTPVDYLENDNDQYIDTGFVPDSNTEIEIKFKAKSTENNGCFIFGAGGSDYQTDGFELYPWSNKWDFNFGSNVTFRPDATTDVVTFSFKNKQAHISNSSTVVTYSNTTSPTKNLILFGINRTTGLTTTGSCRIYYCKIWDNGDLIHDYMPCVRNTDNKPGLYDWVTNTFRSNAGSGEFKAPYYAAVKYITADSNAYINTGYQIKTESMMVDFKCKLPSSFNGLSFFGSNNSTPLYDLVPYHADSYGSYVFQHWIGSSSGILNTTYSSDINNVLYTISNNTLVCNINGEQSSTSFSGSIKSNQDFYIFGKHGSNGSAERASGYTLYYLKLYDGGILVRNFIPVINLLTNEIGLYDNVENKFYSNANSSGSFSAPSIANTHMVDCSGYLIDGVGSNITESKDTAWGNSCAVFNGTSQIITDYKVEGQNNLTYAAWIYQTERTPNEISCISIGRTYLAITGTNWTWGTTTYDEGKLAAYAYGKNPTGYFVGNNTIPLNTWTHIALVWDNTSLHGYINGIEDFVVNTAGTISGTTPQEIGNETGQSRYFKGKIADLRIYTTALSNADILALYQGRAELDNRLNLYGGNFIEEDRIYELTKENVIFAEEFNEEPGNFRWEDKDSYHELEYIESTGTQYINTGVIPTTDTKIDIDFTYLGSSYSAWSPIYGERGLNNSTYFNLFINTTSKQISPNYAGFDPDSSSTTYFTPGARYHVVTDKGQFYLNNELISSLSTSNTLVTSTVSMYLFALGTTSSVDNRGMHARIHSCRFYEGDTLIRNFVPVRWDRTGEIGLYDTIEKKFYTNDGTGDFIAGENRYQRLEYIQSTGTQYIDTGVRYTDNQTLDYELKLKCLANTAQTGSGHHRATIGMNASGNLSVGGQTSTISAREPHTCKIKWSSGIATGTLTRTSFIDGEQIGSTNSSHFDYNPYFIFACCSWTSEGATGSGRPPYTYDSVYVYGCKFWKDNILVRDFIPVKNSETDEVGLFDKVESTFYTNQGTGSFIAGPAVNNLEINKGRWVVGQLIEE